MPTGPRAADAVAGVPDAAAEAGLERLRAAIDGIDRELLALLDRRAAVALEVGEVKRAHGLPAYRPDREAAVVAKLAAAATGAFPPRGVAAVWREVMSACRALEQPTRVAYLGPAGTFSEQAALEHFGASIEHVACTSIDEVFQRTAAGGADFGVVPVENSSEGVVTRSLDLFLATPLVVVAEASLLVRHHLLRRAPSLDGVAVVCAHPQALAQCQAWLGAHLPGVERRAVASNAEGARLASEDASTAALASDRAADRFGLHVVAAAVQDDAHNRTRFAIVARPDALPAPRPSGRDCTSLVVAVDNRPGAVHDLLAPLKRHGVSMTRFESRPARSGQWEYHFYIDIAGHPDEPTVAAALAELRTQCTFWKVLGAYPVA
jgi:chorismate mutase/prephenate dehydratase